MKLLLSLFLLAFAQLQVFSQTAIITDPDGWTNVRKGPSTSSPVLYQLQENEVFVYDEASKHGNWLKVYVEKDPYSITHQEKECIGYVHQSRILPIAELAEYKGSDFSFQYEVKPFQSNKNKIERPEGDKGWITKINGKHPYGTDGNLPSTKVNAVRVEMNHQEIPISSTYYDDLYEANNDVTVYEYNDSYFVEHWNSDGAGGYHITWVFANQQLQQRKFFIP